MRKLFEQLDERDAHVYGGLLLVSVGLAFAYWPLALIVPGTALVLIGVFLGRGRPV